MSSKESARQPALIASAVHITNSPSSGFRKNKAVSTDWQERAWRAFDLVGEYRIISQAIASLVSRADIFIGRLDDNGEIEKITGNADLDALLDPFTKRHGESSETIRRMALNMYVAGECWWVGVPSGGKNDGGLRLDDSLYGKRRSRGSDLSKFSWHLLSMSEVKHETVDNTVTLTLPHGEVKHSLDAVRLARVWEPHPRVHDEADSPTRPALPILEELIGLSMHVSAQVDSRLAGAGILILPQSAQDGIRASMNLDENDTLADPFTESLIQTMQTAIKDRDSASALVPITVTVPDDWVGKIQHLTFSTPLDEEARELRDEAIRRLALSQDAPPELLLGTGCVDDQTEALTRRGWVDGTDLREGDEVLTLNHQTGQAEWKPVQAMNRYLVEDAPMLRLQGRGHDSLTTMNHRWPIIDAATGSRDVVLSEDLTARHRLVTAAPATPVRTAAYTDAFVELAAWFWTEGSYTEGTESRVGVPYTDRRGRHYPNGHPSFTGAWGQASITQSESANPGRVARIRAALAAEYGDGWGFESRQTGEWGSDIVRFNLRQSVWEDLKSVGGKVITLDFVQALTPAQLELFIDVSCQGDGWHYRQGRLDIWQKERAPLEAYALALTLSGRMVTWTQTGGGWCVSDWRGKSTVRPIKAGMDSVEEYTGLVWCPTVENSTWLARRNGTVWFTGNSMNHWGAWMVREDTVNSHVVPRLSSICTALTEQYLWPVAEALGIEDFNDYVIWYDVNDLKARPNRSADAIELHKAGVLSDEALRREAGFEEKDAPVKKTIDAASERTLQMVTQAPTLAQHPGIPVVLAVMRHIIDGDPLPEHLDPWKAFVGHNIEDEDSVAPAVPDEDNPVEHVEDDAEPRAGGQPVTQGERARPEGESL